MPKQCWTSYCNETATFNVKVVVATHPATLPLCDDCLDRARRSKAMNVIRIKAIQPNLPYGRFGNKNPVLEEVKSE